MDFFQSLHVLFYALAVNFLNAVLMNVQEVVERKFSAYFIQLEKK